MDRERLMYLILKYRSWGGNEAKDDPSKDF